MTARAFGQAVASKAMAILQGIILEGRRVQCSTLPTQVYEAVRAALHPHYA